jgi:hypothetical protein
MSRNFVFWCWVFFPYGFSGLLFGWSFWVLGFSSFWACFLWGLALFLPLYTPCVYLGAPYVIFIKLILLIKKNFEITKILILKFKSTKSNWTSSLIVITIINIGLKNKWSRYLVCRVPSTQIYLVFYLAFSWGSYSLC